MKLNLKMGVTSGVVTVKNWIMGPDAARYMYFWCANWLVVPNKSMPVDGFRSTEPWVLFGMVDGNAKMVVPGCEVRGWVQCDKPPPVTPECYRLE